MALSDQEQMMYTDIVKVVNRTENPLEFMYDSKIFIIPPGKKGKNVPRFIAEHGASKHPISFDANNFPVGSLLGIEGDDNFPTDHIAPEELTFIAASDKFGDEVVSDGKLVKKVKMDLKQPKENFAINNLG